MSLSKGAFDAISKELEDLAPWARHRDVLKRWIKAEDLIADTLRGYWTNKLKVPARKPDEATA